MFERCAIEMVIFGCLLAFCGVTRGAGADEAEWYPVKGSPNVGVPEELYSPVVEIAVTHDHADDEPTVPYSSGILINRHIWPGRSIKEYERITRDSAGQDEKPDGTCLPLALFPRKEGVIWGGELLTPEERKGEPSKGKRTRHQRQWDYIQGHVDKALERYCENYSNIWCDPEDSSRRPRLTVEEMTDWQKFNAICNYATAWQARGRLKWKPGGKWVSRHPVDVLHYGHNCGGVSSVIMSMLHVAGFEARNLVWNCHRSTEVKVAGKWVFAERARRPGNELRSGRSWAEISAEPDLMGPPVFDYTKTPTGRGTTYLLAPMMYWHSMGGIDEYEETGHSGHLPLLNYSPSTATALYPTMRVHIFHIPKGRPPTLKLCRRMIGNVAKVPIEPGTAVRKRFYLSDSRDNPITRGEVRYYFKRGGGPADVRCALDGGDLGSGESDSGWLLFEIPPERLTPGEHELVLRNVSDREITLAFQADVTRPYHNPVSGKQITLKASNW